LDADAPTTIGARRVLEASGLTAFVPAALEHADEAADGTTKLLVRLADGLAVEAVLIPHAHLPRTTLCISSQVGCDQGCRFCATARMGLVRNLTPDEILAQFVIASRVASKSTKMPPLTNIVFMGMVLTQRLFSELFRTSSCVDGVVAMPHRRDAVDAAA
jgi:adenine C2-methylase RlmN of 23S rRNA A2503 and tRNA A37